MYLNETNDVYLKLTQLIMVSRYSIGSLGRKRNSTRSIIEDVKLPLEIQLIKLQLIVINFGKHSFLSQYLHT